MQKRFQLVVDINQEREYYIQDTHFGGTIYFHFGGLQKKAAEQLVDLINLSIEIPGNTLKNAIKNEQEVEAWRIAYAAVFGKSMDEKDIKKSLTSAKEQMEYTEAKNIELERQLEKMEKDNTASNHALLKLEEYRQQAIKEITDIRIFINADPNESTYDEVVRMKALMEKEASNDMERMRKTLWAEVAVRACGNGTFYRSSAEISELCDFILADFDKRFNNKEIMDSSK